MVMIYNNTAATADLVFRKPLSHRASRTKPEIMRLVELSNVPQAVTVDDIRDLCETAVQVEDILNVQSQAIGHAWKMTVCSFH